MAEVRRLRLTREPSLTAERLAQAMTVAGVPWSRDTVVNLETGRRKRLAVHELLALAYVLELGSPVDLLAPLLPGEGRMLPVTPRILVRASAVRAWCERQDPPWRAKADESTVTARMPDIEDILRMVREGTLTIEGVDDILTFVRGHLDRKTWGDDGED